MSNQAVNLTPAELQLIEARRAKEEAARLEKEAKEKREEEKRLEKQKRIKAIEDEMTKALLEADTTNLLYTNEKNQLCFLVGGREEEVEIKEHISYGQHTWSRARSNGWKYYVSGWCNNHNQKYWKRPATVIKAIKEYQEEAVRDQKREEDHKIKAQMIFNHLKRSYPLCKIEARYSERCNYNTYFEIESDKARIEASGFVKENGDINIHVRDMRFKTEEVKRDVMDSLLK